MQSQNNEMMSFTIQYRSIRTQQRTIDEETHATLQRGGVESKQD